MTDTTQDPTADTQPSPRTVAVTGSGRGLGLLIVKALLDGGCRVLANYRTPTDELTALHESHPGRLHLCRGDIGEESAAEALVAAARGLGRLDAVIHNAAIIRDQPLVTMPVDDWDAVQRVNLRGSFLVTKHALRLMMRQRYGRMVYVSSGSAVLGNAGQAAYAASKGGLLGLSNTVAQEYARYRVSSVVLAPGLLDTGQGAELGEDLRTQKAGRSLLGAGRGEDMAATAAFLASAQADYINATLIRADGGVAY
ncbi:SDR family NAD(P)-dependent oxidoreductase [Streptomyces kronopolitis]